MIFSDKSIINYADLLASDAPTPGGGSALALVALNATALLELSANVTSAKLKKTGQSSDILSSASEKLKKLRKTLVKLIDDDPAAFENVLTAMRLPKGTDEEKQKRRAAMQKAYFDSALIPLSLMKASAEAFSLADSIIAASDKFVVSDAVVGKNLLVQVVKNSVLNVEANASSLDDMTKRESLRKRAKGFVDAVAN